MKTVLSPPAPGWRMLPPGGAPLGLGAIARALLDSRKGRRMADRFGQALSGRFGAGHVLLSSSGRAALALALTALRQLRPDRDQILLPAYVSYSVPSAVARAGCHISLYDVDPVTLGPRLDSLEAAVSEKTLAVVACHQFGLAFDLEPIRSVCAGAGAFLVDDAAQAMGASVGGVPAGTMGDVGLFSLSRGKPITAVEGGILLCNDDRIADGLRAVQKQLPEPGFSPRAALKAVALAVLRHPAIYRIPASLPWLGIGASVFDPDFEQAGLSAFQAGLGLSSLLELDRINRQRHRKAEVYKRSLSGQNGVGLFGASEDAEPIYLRFPVVSESLAAAVKISPTCQARARALGVSRGFPQSLDDLPELAGHLVTTGAGNGIGNVCPGARYLAENLFTLPTHDQVTLEDCARAAEFVAGCAGLVWRAEEAAA